MKGSPLIAFTRISCYYGILSQFAVLRDTHAAAVPATDEIWAGMGSELLSQTMKEIQELRAKVELLEQRQQEVSYSPTLTGSVLLLLGYPSCVLPV